MNKKSFIAAVLLSVSANSAFAFDPPPPPVPDLDWAFRSAINAMPREQIYDRVFGQATRPKSEWRRPQDIYEGMQLDLYEVKDESLPAKMRGIWWLEEPAQGTMAATFESVDWNNGRPLTSTLTRSWAYQVDGSTDGLAGIILELFRGLNPSGNESGTTSLFTSAAQLAYQWEFDSATNPTYAWFKADGNLIAQTFNLIHLEMRQRGDQNEWERRTCVINPVWKFFGDRCAFEIPNALTGILVGPLNYRVLRIVDEHGNPIDYNIDPESGKSNWELYLEEEDAKANGGFVQGPQVTEQFIDEGGIISQ